MTRTGESTRISTNASASERALSPTPFLDRQIPLPRKNSGDAVIKWWQVLLFLSSLSLELFRILIALWVLQILIHELGHLLGGLAVGQRFGYIRVGAFQVDHAGKVTWHWTQREVLSGATSTLPVARSAIRWRHLVFTAAGPAANFFTGFLVLEFMPQQPSLSAGMGQLFVGGAFFFGITNLIPLQHQGHTSDGLTLWILLFSKGRRERLISILTFVADAREGKSLDSWQLYSFDKTASIDDGTASQVVANLACYFGAKDSESAGRHLEVCLATSSAIDADFRNLLVVEAAKYHVLRSRRFDLARDWLADDRSEKPRFARFQVEALILQHGGRFQEAISKVEDGLKFAQTSPDTTLYESRQRTLNHLRDTLREQMDSGKLPVPS